MLVNGDLLHFIIDSRIQKNPISTKVIKQLKLPKTSHPQPYNIECLNQARDLHVSQRCYLPYAIKPFKDEVSCDISRFEFCDGVLGQPYMWKHHVVYDSRPCSVIVSLEKQLYKIPNVSPTNSNLFGLCK